MMDGAESRVPCGGNSVVGSVGGVSPSRGHDGKSARRHWTVFGETFWSIREFKLRRTVSSAPVSELSTVENY